MKNYTSKTALQKKNKVVKSTINELVLCGLYLVVLGQDAYDEQGNYLGEEVFFESFVNRAERERHFDFLLRNESKDISIKRVPCENH